MRILELEFPILSTQVVLEWIELWGTFETHALGNRRVIMFRQRNFFPRGNEHSSGRARATDVFRTHATLVPSFRDFKREIANVTRRVISITTRDDAGFDAWISIVLVFIILSKLDIHK